MFGQLLMLSTENNLDIRKVMEYPLGPVPWALATSDGFPIKTNKAVLMHMLEDKSALQGLPPDHEHIHIVDGNALYHALHVTDLPETFGQLANRIFCALPKGNIVHFVTDTYKNDSIKSLERVRRRESQTFTVRGSSTKVPRDFKTFLLNDENKKQLTQFLLNEWQEDGYATMLLNREIYFALDHQCFILSSSDGNTTDSRPV